MLLLSTTDSLKDVRNAKARRVYCIVIVKLTKARSVYYTI